MKRLFLLFLLLTASVFAQTFNTDVVPSQSGLKLGRAGQRWNLYASNIDITGSITVNGTAGHFTLYPLFGNGHYATSTDLTTSTLNDCAIFISGNKLGGNPCALLVGGHIPPSQLGSGTAILGNCLNGDGTWQICGGGGGGGTSFYYNVIDYGMVGDGTTDNTVAMNTLLASIGSANATLIFTAGQFSLSSITLPSNINLDFSAGGALKTITSTTPTGGAAFVQGKSSEWTSSATGAVTLTSPITAGNTIVAMVEPYPGFTYVINSVTDSCGNYYAHVQQSLINQPRNVGAWVASNAIAGSCVITATASGVLTDGQIIVHEYSGLGPIVAIDGNGVSANSTGTTMSSGSVSTTAGSLLIGYGGQHINSETCSAGAGYTQPASTAGQSASGYLCAEYKLVSAGGSTSATQTITTDPSPATWVYNLLALKPGSATITALGGIFNPDNHKIFFNATGSNGIINFSGNYSLTTVYPEWWGASPTASAANNTPALQAAIKGAFGSRRTNSSGDFKYNRILHFSGGTYQINDELQAYSMNGFLWTGEGRLQSVLQQTVANKRIIDGQSVSYGSFENMGFSTSASQDASHALIDLDYNGTDTPGDLRPQFIDFKFVGVGGGGLAAVGIQIAKSGGGAQGSNINCWNCSLSGFTTAAWRQGTPISYAYNALNNSFIQGDIQSSPTYGIAVYAGDIKVRDTTFENGFTAQTGFDIYCEAPQYPCNIENVRSESRRLAAGNPIRIVNSKTINQALFPTPGVTFPIFPAGSSIIMGSAVGGDGHYYKVTAQSAVFGGLGTPSATLTATSGSATTIVDSTASYTVNAFTGFLASVMSGTNVGCYGVITSNTATAITVTAWLTKYQYVPCTAPDATSRFIVEPNWGTQFTSGGMTWADMNENGIEGNLGGGLGTAVLDTVDIPGDKITFASGTGVTLRNVTVTRNDWTPTGGPWNSWPTILNDIDVQNRNTIAQGGSTRWQTASLPRINHSNTFFSGNAQRNLGTKASVWSCGEPSGATTCNDVAIGGRSDPLASNGVSRNILEYMGMLGRKTPFGTNQAGTDTQIQGGLSTGSGAPGNIDFWLGVAGASGTGVNAGTAKWKFLGSDFSLLGPEISTPSVSPSAGSQKIYVKAGAGVCSKDSAGVEYCPVGAGILAKANGGTGTSTPALVAGTNITITGSWPNQTIDASGAVATGFDNISSATNTTAAMVVGTGASLAVAGSGTIAATTATALAANPTDCGANTFANTIAASGNLTCATVPGAAMTNNTVTATQLAAQYSKWLVCTGKGLGDGLNVIPLGTYLATTCRNLTGVTVTITGIQCFTDNNGTSTMNVTNGAGTSLLTGNITCSNSYAAGTQSATVTLANNDFLKFTYGADGTTRQFDVNVPGQF